MKCVVQDLVTNFGNRYMTVSQRMFLNKHSIRVIFRYYYDTYNAHYEIVIDDADRVGDFMAYFYGDGKEQYKFIRWLNTGCEYNACEYSCYNENYFKTGYVRTFRRYFPTIIRGILTKVAEYDGIM